MTTITVPRETWDAMRETLDTIIQYNRDHARDQYGDAEKAERWACVVKARQALTAANAVSKQPEPPSDENIADAWISASDSDGIAYDGPSFERGYRLGRGEYDEYTGALVAAAKAEALTATNAVSVEPQEPAITWPQDAAEIREFIGSNFNSRTEDGEPSDDDKYSLTAHDLLSAFSEWVEFVDMDALRERRNAFHPQATEPAPKRITVTDDMHRAAVKVLHRAPGLDGLPQRMMDAMLAAAPKQPTNNVQE